MNSTPVGSMSLPSPADLYLCLRIRDPFNTYNYVHSLPPLETKKILITL